MQHSPAQNRSTRITGTCIDATSFMSSTKHVLCYGIVEVDLLTIFVRDDWYLCAGDNTVTTLFTEQKCFFFVKGLPQPHAVYWCPLRRCSFAFPIRLWCIGDFSAVVGN